MTTPELTETQRFWLKHVRACDSKGQTAAEYTSAKNLNRQTFYSWRRNLRRMGVLDSPTERKSRPRSRGSFRVATIVDSEEGRCVVRVRFRNGVILELDSTSSVPETELLSKLASLP